MFRVFPRAALSLSRLLRAPQRHVIAGHGSISQALALEARDGGLLTDGMGRGGHNASSVGQDFAVVRAEPGQIAQLELLALWLSQRSTTVRVSIDDGEDTVLQGTVLPPMDGGGRRFRSKVGGKIQVLLATHELGSLSFVSLGLSAICSDAWAMVQWNMTVAYQPGGAGPCEVPSPTAFAYPASYTVQPMDTSNGGHVQPDMSPTFEPAADRWTEGKDDLSAAASGGGKYFGGVLLPDGRVVLVPYNAGHVGLYDPNTDRWTEGQDDLSALGIGKYEGGVLLPDGRVVLVPEYASSVGLYDPSTDSWTEGMDDLSALGYASKYRGGVLLPDGRVLLVPEYAQHVGLYDPSTDRWTEGKDDLSAVGGSKYFGGVLLPDGRVMLVPYEAQHVGLYDPRTDRWTEGQDHLSASYRGGVLLPDGRVLLVPYNTQRVGLYDPSTDRWTEGQDDLSGAGSGKYYGGVLLPDGRVLLVPRNAQHVGLYNPSTDRWTEGKDDLSALGTGKYEGGVLLPDGRVVLVPTFAERVGLYDAGGTRKGAAYTVRNVPVAVNALLLPYYNKL